MAAHDDEQLLNGQLATLLSEHGLSAQAERRIGKKKIDVEVRLDGLTVMLEAEADNQKQAIKEAEGRLRDGLTSIVFAINYTAGLTVDSFGQGTRLDWSLRTEAARLLKQPIAWSSGDVGELAAAINQAPHAFEIDDAARELSTALDEAVALLPTSTRRALARDLDLPQDKDLQHGWQKAAKRGLLVVATAMLFHHRLHEHLPPLAPPGWSDGWPPATASACADDDNPISAYRDAWRAILEIDYRPVFETARSALQALPATSESAGAIRLLATRIEALMPRTAGLRHDLLGRIFHGVLDTARYDGSFYTSTAAAVLLAGLALREEDCDWSDPDAVAALRICDPACGTGTLLMAAAERIRDLRRQASPGLDADAEALLAQSMVEDVLWGYDINLTATHMAATTLGMLSPKTQFSRMNIYRTLLGVQGGRAYTGSLEFLDQRPMLMPWPGQSSVSHVEATDQPGAQPPPMDLVIMNPPFTRDSLRHDQFAREQELQLKNREQEIQSGLEFAAAGRRHSLGGMFTMLATRLARSDRGTIALILPSVVPTAPGNHALREFLGQHFHVDTVVSSHDPQRINMSENTSIGEVLIICRRWASEEPKPSTKFYNLARNPATAHEAMELLNQIKRDDRRDYTLQYVDAERIASGDWYAVNFFSPYLVREYRRIATGHYNTTQHNTTQHNTTQHNTTQHNTTQHNTTQHNTTQHNTQHNTTQHNTTQHNTTQHNTTQHNTTSVDVGQCSAASQTWSLMVAARRMRTTIQTRPQQKAVARCTTTAQKS